MLSLGEKSKFVEVAILRILGGPALGDAGCRSRAIRNLVEEHHRQIGLELRMGFVVDTWMRILGATA